MNMQTGELIAFFAEHGYMIDQNALSYLKAHDHLEILEAVETYMPQILVIDLTAIRKIHKSKRSNVIVKYVDTFKTGIIQNMDKFGISRG